MKPPYRLITDEVDLNYELFSVVGSDGKVMCNIACDRTSTKSMQEAEARGLMIVEGLNHECPTGNDMSDNFCATNGKEPVSKSRNPWGRRGKPK